LIRLFLRFFGIKDFEQCKSCETLKQQLEFERAEKQQLINTLVEIVHPKPPIVEQPPQMLTQIPMGATTFTRRRAALEALERANAKILGEKRFVKEPDSQQTAKEIETLEKELGVEEQPEEVS